jgi:hypothetical protein
VRIVAVSRAQGDDFGGDGACSTGALRAFFVAEFFFGGGAAEP